MNASHIVSAVFAFVLLLVVGFVVAVAIKAGVDGTTFVDSWNAIWGITATPETPDPDTAGDAVETVAALLK